ncbi:MAG: hypothetical protein M1836_006042 [Candelina mexicana]|nr:MAG: hypothetical protein M1836_006042 [Candelina mexicana]
MVLYLDGQLYEMEAPDLSSRLRTWRSSKPFILATVTVALFAELFLFGFIVPILPFMLQIRLHVDPNQVQLVTSSLLAIFAATQVITAPPVGHIADKLPHRKGPLLIGLVIALTGTALMAAAPHVSLLFIGRTLLGISASIIWVVGLATVADTVGGENMGKTMGSVGAILTAGTLSGPMVSGVLLQTVGYWATWATAIFVLMIDVIMRLIMIEHPKLQGRTKPKASVVEEVTFGTEARCIADSQPAALSFPQPHPSSTVVKSLRSPSASSFTSSDAFSSRRASITSTTSSRSACPSMLASTKASTPAEPADIFTEQTPLLFPTKITYESTNREESNVKPVSPVGFYTLLFRQRRIIGSAIVNVTYAIILSSFDATLPLHVQEVFGWGSLPAGMMFFTLQVPGIICGPLCGWLRDRIGVRYPTTIGYILLTPLVFALGIPGSSTYALVEGEKGKAMYTTLMACIGAVMNLAAGVGTIEGILVIENLEAESPGIFGPNGGYSRLFSLQSVIYTMGMLVGPEISGILTHKVGYARMNMVLGMQVAQALIDSKDHMD